MAGLPDIFGDESPEREQGENFFTPGVLAVMGLVGVVTLIVIGVFIRWLLQNPRKKNKPAAGAMNPAQGGIPSAQGPPPPSVDQSRNGSRHGSRRASPMDFWGGNDSSRDLDGSDRPRRARRDRSERSGRGGRSEANSSDFMSSKYNSRSMGDGRRRAPKKKQAMDLTGVILN